MTVTLLFQTSCLILYIQYQFFFSNTQSANHVYQNDHIYQIKYVSNLTYLSINNMRTVRALYTGS